MLWYAGFRGLLNRLVAHDLGLFKTEHLNEIRALARDEDIWLDVDVLFALALKP